MLIDFGEVIQLSNENIFNIEDEGTKKKVYSFPTLAFQCKIAKIRAPINGQLKANWSSQTKTVVIDKLLKNVKGKVSLIIINIFKHIYGCKPLI